MRPIKVQSLTLRSLEQIVRPTPAAKRHAHRAKAEQHHRPGSRLRYRTRAQLRKAGDGVAASREVDSVSVINVRVEVKRAQEAEVQPRAVLDVAASRCEVIIDNEQWVVARGLSG